jgi:hypothetical protein
MLAQLCVLRSTDIIILRVKVARVLGKGSRKPGEFYTTTVEGADREWLI